MFNQNVVFVIGAGASAELNLPTGMVLTESIGKALGFEFDFGRINSGDPALHRYVLNKYGDKASSYLQSACELARIVGTFVSIDEALHYFSARPEIIAVGKVAIVREILRAERNSFLYNKGDQNLASLTGIENSWLPKFFRMSLSSHKFEELESVFANVTIINFNYDRTLEHFLYTALQRQAHADEPTARKIVSDLKIIRPYGSIGDLGLTGRAGVRFGADISADHENLFSVSQCIRTYAEQSLSTELQNQILDAIEDANVVLFLGFGFHAQNMQLLHTRVKSADRRAFATVHGIDSENFELLKDRISGALGCVDHDPRLVPWKAHELLEKLRPSIMAVAS